MATQITINKELINERNNPMKLAKWTFLIAGIYGLIIDKHSTMRGWNTTANYLNIRTNELRN